MVTLITHLKLWDTSWSPKWFLNCSRVQARELKIFVVVYSKPCNGLSNFNTLWTHPNNCDNFPKIRAHCDNEIVPKHVSQWLHSTHSEIRNLAILSLYCIRVQLGPLELVGGAQISHIFSPASLNLVRFINLARIFLKGIEKSCLYVHIRVTILNLKSGNGTRSF